MASDKTTLVLSNKNSLNGPKSLLINFLAVAAITGLPVIIAMIAIIFAQPEIAWSQLPAKFGSINWPRTFLGSLDGFLLLGMLLALVIYQNKARKFERLTLSPDGIQYTSPLPPFAKRINPDWFLAWNQIKRAELGTPIKGRLLNQEGVLLTLESASDKRRIFPSHWVNPANYSQSISLFKLPRKLIKQPQDEILKSVMASEVARYISQYAPHITIDSNLDKAESFNSLERNPHGRISIVIITLLILYAVIDLMVGSESYIDPPSSLAYIYISAGILGATLSAAWLYKSTLTNFEKSGLAMLIGVVVSAAMLPGALRINALTDTNGPVTYDYYVTQGAGRVVLRPVVNSMPVIDYFAKNNFWGKFGKNDTYPVQIRKGGLGFYQFNSSIIVEDIHNH